MSRPLESRTLGALIDAAAAALRDREAVVFGPDRVSFATLQADVDRTAKGLIALGVAQGAHVMVWMPNSLEWLHVFYAIAKIGAVAIPINTRFRTVDLAYVLRQSDASTLIMAGAFAGTDYLAMLRELIPEIDRAGPLASPHFPRLERVIVHGELSVKNTISWRALLSNGAAVGTDVLAERARSVDPNAPALMLYTSGTTGSPKGALHSHAMIRTVSDGASRLGITSRDRILLFLPLFHSMGLYLAGILFLVAGARLILMDRFDAGAAWSLIERERCSLLLGFDTHFFDMLEHPTRQATQATDASSVRLAMVPAGASGVAPIARRVNRELCRTFSGYGSSECGTGVALTFIDAPEHERCLGSGFPMPGYEYETRDPATGLRVQPGETGELFVRGYGVMQGYYGKPDDTVRAFDEQGWFRTGDAAIIDADGFLRYIGRYKDMLKVGGENVDPTEVEAFLEAHPAIAQVKIVGIPDPRLGDKPVACVLPRAGHSITLTELREYCQDKIASYKIPREMVIVDGFPLTTTGKVQRGVLRDQVMSRLT